jgi:hypothetical protein
MCGHDAVSGFPALPGSHSNSYLYFIRLMPFDFKVSETPVKATPEEAQ